jgi:hypothetical protein
VVSGLWLVKKAAFQVSSPDYPERTSAKTPLRGKLEWLVVRKVFDFLLTTNH